MHKDLFRLFVFARPSGTPRNLAALGRCRDISVHASLDACTVLPVVEQFCVEVLPTGWASVLNRVIHGRSTRAFDVWGMHGLRDAAMIRTDVGGAPVRSGGHGP